MFNFQERHDKYITDIVNLFSNNVVVWASSSLSSAIYYGSYIQRMKLCGKEYDFDEHGRLFVENEHKEMFTNLVRGGIGSYEFKKALFHAYWFGGFIERFGI